MPAGLTTHRGTRDARRFAVYRNNVHVGLVGALEKAFPVVRQLVGDGFFQIMARAYVAAEKPASPVMLDYGHGFPDFVAGFAPAEGLPYLADVARLEVALTQAYHAAEADALDRTGLAGLDLSRLDATTLALHPAARLVRSPCPVGTIWSHHQAQPVRPVEHWRGRGGAGDAAGCGIALDHPAALRRGLRGGAAGGATVWRRRPGRLSTRTRHSPSARR